MNTQIETIINARRPGLAPLTINCNARHILRLYQHIYPDDQIFDVTKLENTPIELITEYIDTKGLPTRKNIASSMGYIKSHVVYKRYILECGNSYRDRVNAHIPSDRDLTSIVTPEILSEVDARLLDDYTKTYVDGVVAYSKKDFKKLTNYITFQLVSGLHIPPRRSLDWVAMKVKNIDPLLDNYMDGDVFVFNRYKTDKIYGQQRISVPPKLLEILAQWQLINPYEYLIPTVLGRMYQVSNFYETINSFMHTAKGSGTNKFRKGYLQNKFGSMTSIADTMADMGSSPGVLNSYITRLA